LTRSTSTKWPKPAWRNSKLASAKQSRSGSRKSNHKRGPLAGSAFRADRAVMVGDDLVYQGQAQAGAGILGGEERDEHALQVVGGDARPVVLKFQANRRAVFAFFLERADHHPSGSALFGHRFAAIQHQVGKSL